MPASSIDAGETFTAFLVAAGRDAWRTPNAAKT
jgi:hypothetical protein